jgi:hypothetical protein
VRFPRGIGSRRPRCPTIEIDPVDLVDDLPHQRAVFHAVVGSVEGGFNERDDVATAVEDFQPGQQVVVSKGEQSVPGDAFFIGGPVGPAEFVWKRGFIVVAQDFHLLFTIIEDFQEEHPAELSKSLSIAINTSIFAQDILDGLDEVGDVGHGANRIDE